MCGQVERIFAHKADPAKQDQRLLVKWRGLPYAESTFESLQDVLKIGGQQDIIEYQVCPQPTAFASPACPMSRFLNEHLRHDFIHDSKWRDTLQPNMRRNCCRSESGG